MPVSHALRNLLKVRNLEVDQQRAALESALNELHALERALDVARARRLEARCALFHNCEMDGMTRLGHQLQQDVEQRRQKFLEVCRLEAQDRAEDARMQFLNKRLEQRQAETLVHAARQREKIEAEKRLQHSIDDRHARTASNRSKTSKRTRDSSET